MILGLLTACSGSRITSLSRERGAPGEEFTIFGKKLKDSYSLPVIPPVLKRCSEFSLQILEHEEDHIRVRIPPEVPAGVYDVFAYGEPPGAYQRAKTNSLKFWVLAAPVSDTLSDRYEVQVKSFRSRYGKDAAWETWMMTNRARYDNVVPAALATPCPIRIAVSYASPVPYNPPWTNEAEHMTALNRMANVHFPGYQFDFQFGIERSTAYAECILGWPGNSDASGRTLRLHFETIFGHEFAHILNVAHHYEGASLGNSGFHFPPGETLCIMDRNANEYCSACRTAMNLPLDVNNRQAILDAIDVILDRYPPGW